MAFAAWDSGRRAPERALAWRCEEREAEFGVGPAGGSLAGRRRQSRTRRTSRPLRARAIVAVMLGGALRRSETAARTMGHVTWHDGRRCIVLFSQLEEDV